MLIVVTGGGTGLGLVAAATLAENGARVYISGRRGEVLKKAAELGKPTSGKGEIIPVEADCSTKDGIQSEYAFLKGMTADARRARQGGLR